MGRNDDRGAEGGRRSGPESPSAKEGGRPVAGGSAAVNKRMGPRSFFVTAAVVVGAAVPLRHGLLRHGLGKSLAAWRLRAPERPVIAPAAASQASGNLSPVPSSPPSGSPDAMPGPPHVAGSPSPDPRVARALDTPVCLQAGKVSLWTALRRLGVRLTWPEAGEPQWTVDERRFSRGLRRLARRVEHLPRNARLIHRAGGLQALPAHPGRMLDRAAARGQLLKALDGPAFRHSLDVPPPEKPVPITLVLSLHEVPPTVTADHLGAINTLLATYSTALGGSSRNRRHNIRVACAAIDGTVLMPGEVFSYNEIVGPRSERAGFRTAPVIIHGELVPGTGGGVCQVSSTLYNVALLGDLKIVRRSHHQFPVHYVPPGRDATVAYGSLDLRFANSLPGPVALDVKTDGSRVMIRLYGSADCKRDVRLVSSRVTSTRSRARVAAGGPARPGKRVTVTRMVRREDGTRHREVISHDVYAPAPLSSHGSPGHHRRGRRGRISGGKRQGAPKKRPSLSRPPVSASQPAGSQ